MLPQLLHARYLLELLHETRKALKGQANIHQISTKVSQQVTVVGDLHGKLDDLLIILYKVSTITIIINQTVYSPRILRTNIIQTGVVLVTFLVAYHMVHFLVAAFLQHIWKIYIIWYIYIYIYHIIQFFQNIKNIHV